MHRSTHASILLWCCHADRHPGARERLTVELSAAVTGLLLKQLAYPEPNFTERVLEPLLNELTAALVAPSAGSAAANW